MSRVAIPPWTAGGLLPPIDPAQPTSPDRSPYLVSLVDFVVRFGTSPERRQILDGFLRCRERLHAVGLIGGFQWLNGSFMENVETLEGRAPKDLDVVTFFRLPAGVTETAILGQAPELFPRTHAEHLALKALYNVDAHLANLAIPAELLVERSVYWYSVWSHRRDGQWKGYLQLDLRPSEDVAGAALLRAPPAPRGGTP